MKKEKAPSVSPLLTLSVEAYPENQEGDDISGKTKRHIVDVLDKLLDFSLKQMVSLINQKSSIEGNSSLLLSWEEIQPLFRRNYKMNGRFIEVEVKADVSRLPERYTENIFKLHDHEVQSTMKNPLMVIGFHAVSFLCGLNKQEKAEVLQETRDKIKNHQWQEFSNRFATLLLGGTEEAVNSIIKNPEVAPLQENWKSFQMRRKP